MTAIIRNVALADFVFIRWSVWGAQAQSRHARVAGIGADTKAEPLQ